MEKEQRIILTTLELVVKQGFHATPMSQVAREANVAVGTIYHYFKNKEQIIEKIFLMIYKDFGTVMLTNIKPADDYKTQFSTMWRNLYNYFLSNPLAFYFVEYVGVPPLITPEIAKKSKPFYAEVVDFCTQGVQTKKLKNIDEVLITNLCYGIISSAVKLKIKEELPMSEKQIDQTIEACWNAVKYE